MKKIYVFLLALVFLSFTQEKIDVLYRSLNPHSISSHLAFYHLFPDTPEGKRALSDAWKLLSGTNALTPLSYVPQEAIDSIVALITKKEGIAINPADFLAIEQLAGHLPNRKLKGHLVENEAEVLALSPEEVDLSRGLLVAQGEEQLKGYEALIDLMALQILTQAPLSSTPEKKIREINRFIFEEMGYRFPPHSAYSKDIDLYTYLPSVIDSKKGVCLGVSILYLALSQRLGLPLEAITPPGHIYVRYLGPPERNIETTARGIHVDTKKYLSIESEDLPVRTMKDVIGLAYFNEASVHWQSENYQKALNCYQKAVLYLPDDLLLQELMGFNYLFVGEKEKGDLILARVYQSPRGGKPFLETSVVEDYLHGKANTEAIRTLFSHVDENRASLLHKKEQLEATIKNCPLFRAPHFHLAITLLQLHRMGEALTTLTHYLTLEKNDPSAQFLMAELHAARSNYPAAWHHLSHAKNLLSSRKELPEAIRHFEQALSLRSPE